jgi:hypothetical protein
MKIGYIIASHEVGQRRRRVGYLYREEPDNATDSGWRVFAGDESQEYADNADNFAMYNASTIVEIDPSIAELLAHDYPIAFARDVNSSEFVKVEETS